MTPGVRTGNNRPVGMTQLSKPVTLTLLWLWAGAGIMFAAFTAPTLFNPNVLDDRELSGAIAGAILKRYFTASYYVLGACALFSLLGWIADMKARRKVEILFFLSVLLFAANIFQDKVVRTRMVRIKLDLKNTPGGAEQNVLRTEFNTWHRISTGLFGGSLLVTLVCAGFVTLAGEGSRKTARKS
jgi:hypothetical protein